MLNVKPAEYKDRCRGMLVGLAVGDVLGANLEFTKSSHKEITDAEVSHMFDGMYPKGAWTDDTSMALCLADSLLEKGGYDSYDVMQKYSDWVNNGYRSYDGKPATDVGGQVRAAVSAYDNDSKIVHAGEPRTNNAGNGAIMRLAPIIIAATTLDFIKIKDSVNLPFGVLFYDEDNADCEFINSSIIGNVQQLCKISARETHYSTEAEAATELFGTMLYCAARLNNKRYMWAFLTRLIIDNKEAWGIYKRIDDMICTDGRTEITDGKNLVDLGGYIVDSIAIALWGLLKFDSFEDGMKAVLKLGGDTDTNGAIYGQLAGAYYGYKAIPAGWKRDTLEEESIKNLADKLFAMQGCPIIRTRFEEDEENFTPASTKSPVSISS